MRRRLPRWGAAILLAIGLAALAAVPAAAKDTYAFFGPLEIRIIGANGDLRGFIALSPDDRRGAAALVEQITGAMQGAVQPIEQTAPPLPHYRIGVSHLGMTYATMPWARTAETSFIYYPGGDGSSFLIVEFSRSNARLEQRWLVPSAEVSALIRRHVAGLEPIGTESAGGAASSAPWGIAIGAVLLAGLSMLLFEDRRRWRLGGEGAPERGRNRRS